MPQITNVFKGKRARWPTFQWVYWVPWQVCLTVLPPRPISEAVAVVLSTPSSSTQTPGEVTTQNDHKNTLIHKLAQVQVIPKSWNEPPERENLAFRQRFLFTFRTILGVEELQRGQLLIQARNITPVGQRKHKRHYTRCNPREHLTPCGNDDFREWDERTVGR